MPAQCLSQMSLGQVASFIEQAGEKFNILFAQEQKFEHLPVRDQPLSDGFMQDFQQWQKLSWKGEKLLRVQRCFNTTLGSLSAALIAVYLYLAVKVPLQITPNSVTYLMFIMVTIVVINLVFVILIVSREGKEKRQERKTRHWLLDVERVEREIDLPFERIANLSIEQLRERARKILIAHAFRYAVKQTKMYALTATLSSPFNMTSFVTSAMSDACESYKKFSSAFFCFWWLNFNVETQDEYQEEALRLVDLMTKKRKR